MSYRVYYEDTDSLGVVFYANYLKYMERGRSEYLAAHALDVAELNRRGHLVVVHSMTMTWRRPARLWDLVDVVTSFSVASRFRGTFAQRIERGGELLTDAKVEVVCIDNDQQLVSLPEEIVALAT
jgi:tol-pal system-associated acyl-CoA thioesterase